MPATAKLTNLLVRLFKDVSYSACGLYHQPFGPERFDEVQMALKRAGFPNDANELKEMYEDDFGQKLKAVRDRPSCPAHYSKEDREAFEDQQVDERRALTLAGKNLAATILSITKVKRLSAEEEKVIGETLKTLSMFPFWDNVQTVEFAKSGTNYEKRSSTTPHKDVVEEGAWNPPCPEGCGPAVHADLVDAVRKMKGCWFTSGKLRAGYTRDTVSPWLQTMHALGFLSRDGKKPRFSYKMTMPDNN